MGSEMCIRDRPNLVVSTGPCIRAVRGVDVCVEFGLREQFAPAPASDHVVRRFDPGGEDISRVTNPVERPLRSRVRGALVVPSPRARDQVFLQLFRGERTLGRTAAVRAFGPGGVAGQGGARPAPQRGREGAVFGRLRVHVVQAEPSGRKLVALLVQLPLDDGVVRGQLRTARCCTTCAPFSAGRASAPAARPRGALPHARPHIRSRAGPCAACTRRRPCCGGAARYQDSFASRPWCKASRWCWRHACRSSQAAAVQTAGG